MYWFETGTPAFLVRHLHKGQYNLDNISKDDAERQTKLHVGLRVLMGVLHIHLLQGQLAPRAAVECVQHLCEDIVRGHPVKQGHARADLLRVQFPENLMCGQIAVLQKFSRNLAKPLSEDGVAEVCPGFADVPYPIQIRVAAVPQPFNLGEYVPYPVSHLPPVPYFRQSRLVVPILRLDEARQRIAPFIVVRLFPDDVFFYEVFNPLNHRC